MCLFRIVYTSSVAGKKVMRVSETLELELCAYWELHPGPLEEQQEPVLFNYWAISAAQFWLLKSENIGLFQDLDF